MSHRRRRDVRIIEVVLEPTESAADRLRVAAIAGVSKASLDESDGHMVLLTDSLYSDGVLTKAIAQGWSVRSVREVPPEASRLMIALVRYVGRDTFRSQRWVAPLLAFAVIDAIIGAQAGSVLPRMRSARQRCSSSRRG